MMTRQLSLPDDLRKRLHKLFLRRCGEWLNDRGVWPLSFELGCPTEAEVNHDPEAVRAWIRAWSDYSGAGAVEWEQKRFRSLGTQKLPRSVTLESIEDLAEWTEQSCRWKSAYSRYNRLIAAWPGAAGQFSPLFDILADYSDKDFLQIEAFLSWITSNKTSGLFPRQVPIAGVETKWLESHKTNLSKLLTAVDDLVPGSSDFYQACGLRRQPELMRLRILDPQLAAATGGLTDISARPNEVAALKIAAKTVFIVENLQTALAFEALAGAIVIFGSGYSVGSIQLPRLENARIFYWGDIDTHGFAILNQVRCLLPDKEIESLFMDDQTLLRHKDHWVKEPVQHAAESFLHLSAEEQRLYSALKSHKHGDSLRLEQERILWPAAWEKIQSLRVV